MLIRAWKCAICGHLGDKPEMVKLRFYETGWSDGIWQTFWICRKHMTGVPVPGILW